MRSAAADGSNRSYHLNEVRVHGSMAGDKDYIDETPHFNAHYGSPEEMASGIVEIIQSSNQPITILDGGSLIEIGGGNYSSFVTFDKTGITRSGGPLEKAEIATINGIVQSLLNAKP